MVWQSLASQNQALFLATAPVSMKKQSTAHYLDVTRLRFGGEAVVFLFSFL
jgi:hypothetical protein